MFTHVVFYVGDISDIQSVREHSRHTSKEIAEAFRDQLNESMPTVTSCYLSCEIAKWDEAIAGRLHAAL